MDGDANPALREAADVAATAGPHTFGLAQCHDVTPPDASDTPAVMRAAGDLGGAQLSADTLERLSKPELIELILRYGSALAALTRKVAHLEGILAKNSRNSSKPPSSDPITRKPAPAPKLDDGVKRKPGGQPGHKGCALKRVANPDEIVEHRVDQTCECGLRLSPLLQEYRQVFDLPAPVMRVVEHRTFSASCACGKTHRSNFPEGVTAATQYGPNIQAQAVYLTHHHMLPISRLVPTSSATSAAKACLLARSGPW